MKKFKSLLFIVCLHIMSFSLVYAQANKPLRTGIYACVSSNLTMELRSNRTMSVYIGKQKMSGDWATGTYRISEDNKRITLTFNRANGGLISLNGMTLSYAIYDNESFFNSQEEWMFIGN